MEYAYEIMYRRYLDGESLVDSLHQEISDFISITGQTIEDFFVESSLRKIEFGSNSNTNKKS